MAKQSGIGQKLYLQGVDLSGDVGSIQDASSPTNPLDVTAIDQSGMARILGRRDSKLDFMAFFNTTSTHPALAALPTTDVLALYLMGTTAGNACCGLSAKQVNYDATRGTDGSLTFAVSLLAAAGFFLEWGDVLVAKTTHASATDETGIDFGAQTTSGAVGFLQHFSAASGTVEYDIEDSSDSTDGDDGSWANLLAFSDVATPYAAIAQRVAVNGTVERWTRASTNGTFTDAVFAMGLRRRASGDVDAA